MPHTSHVTPVFRSCPRDSLCSKCGILLKGKTAIRMHMKVKHPSNGIKDVTIFTCPCGESFTSKEFILAHGRKCKSYVSKNVNKFY